jgi:hypothetical protein
MGGKTMLAFYSSCGCRGGESDFIYIVDAPPLFSL